MKRYREKRDREEGEECFARPISSGSNEIIAEGVIAGMVNQSHVRK